MKFKLLEKLDNNHQNTGQIINQIQNIAHISHIFFILSSSLDISEIYACHTEKPLAHNHHINLAKANIYKFGLRAKAKYQITFNQIVNSKTLFLQYLSDNFQKISHQKNIHNEKIAYVAQT